MAMDLTPFVSSLRRGQVVGCPTETTHGLLADALDATAVARVASLKGRGDAPMAVLVANLEMVEEVALLPAGVGRRLAEQHWPGPLTLILDAREGLAAQLVRGSTIGVRVPGPSPALDLVRAFGGPLTATSANLSGEPDATTAQEVERYFPEGLGGIVPGVAPGGLASTVVDARDGLRVLREGPIALGSA